MIKTRRIILTVSMLLAVGAPPLSLHAEDAQPGSTVKLRLTPAAPARPALKHALLPDESDMTPGDAAPLYLSATLLSARARTNYLLSSGGAAPPAKGDKNPAPDPDAPLLRFLEAAPEELRQDRKPADALVQSYSRALRQVELAARRDYCRWDLPFREEGFAALLPHLSEMRSLAQVLSLRARLEILDARYDDAAATLASGFAMARHLNEDALLVQSLYAAAVATLMLERTREFVSSPGAPNLYWALTALPQPLVEPRQPMRERSIAELAIPDLGRLARGELPPAQWERVLERVREAGGGSGGTWGEKLPAAAVAMKVYPAAKRALIASGQPAARVEALPVAAVVGEYQFRRYREQSDELWKWFALPYWQGAAGMGRAMAELDRGTREEPGNPFTMLLPAVGAARLRLAQVERSVAALRVVEALRAYAAAHEGRLPESLEDATDLPLPADPLSGRPFSYEARGETAVVEAPPFRPAPPLKFQLNTAR